MIQRIQTLFLFLVVLGMGAFAFLPIWEKTAKNGVQKLWLNAQYLLHKVDSVRSVSEPVFYFAGGALVVAGIALFTIFKYRNRLLQSALCAANSLLMIALLGGVIYWTIFRVGKLFLPDFPGNFLYGFYGLIVAMVSNVLANRFIRRDEKTVRDSNRFR